MSLADYGQYDWIRRFLGPGTGRCLEIGARDGYERSQTLDLIRAGWRAVLVEPHFVHCRRMQTMYEDLGVSDRCTIVNAAILPDHEVSSGRVIMYDPLPQNDGPSPASSVLKSWADIWMTPFYRVTNSTMTLDEVPAIGLGRLLEQQGMDFDFVAIDAEGLSVPLALAMPWDCMPTRLLSVEAQRHSVPEFEAKGWKLREIFAPDLFFGR